MLFNIIKIHQLKSTNNHACQLIEDGELHEGDVIFTLNQEKGRGQRDTYWESESGKNISITIVLEPRMIHPSKQFVLTQLVSLAIADLINEYVQVGSGEQQIKIKWPNDIYVNNKKIAGILFQNFVSGNKINYSMCGIGINVNQEKFYSDAANPVSIIHHTGIPIDVEVLLYKLLDNIGVNYRFFQVEENFSELKSKYINKLFRFNEWADYSDGKNTFRGKIVDVDDYGRLLVMLEIGEEKKFMFKEIEFLNIE
ncbi:MAG: biotin--[acetyl-CoA-carboxylase] ligase [Bacteroidetes bacterium]|nr:biotin--[acetyl-CoA-carboxylase] ligase [Bacteroidota bacterium]MBL6944809.1 biotin--[acetyl-CoA-carboxylase] ligase [Bacteroidales bacterium]